MTAQTRRGAVEALTWLREQASLAYLDVCSEWNALPDGTAEKEAAWKHVTANLEALYALRTYSDVTA